MNTTLPAANPFNQNRPGQLHRDRSTARGLENRVPPSGGNGGGRVDRRVIRAVHDLTLPLTQQLRWVAEVLDPLSVGGLSDLRRATWQANRAGRARFICACCKEPVRLVQSPAGPGVPRDGRGAHFAHLPREGAPPCDWRSDPSKYTSRGTIHDGQQEGALHNSRKQQLAECLRRDARFSDVRVEKQIRAGGAWRQPDVSAVFEGRTIAFDVQLRVLSLSDIMARETFYAANDIHHVVLTDAGDPDRLVRLAFNDMHMSAGGRIFAIDESAVEVSMRDRKLQLLELSLVPRARPHMRLDNVWRCQRVGVEAIMQEPTRRRIEGETLYVQTLRKIAKAEFGRLRQRLRDAGAKGVGLQPVRAAYAGIAGQIEAPSYVQAEKDGLGLVFAWLGQAEVAYGDVSIHRPASLRELEKRGLALLVHPMAASWISLMELVTELVPSARQTITQTIVDRMSALRTKRTTLHLMHLHRDMLILMHPWLGFRLLASPPIGQRRLH